MDQTLHHYVSSNHYKRKKLMVRRNQQQQQGNETAPRNPVARGRSGGGVDHLFFWKGSQVEVSTDDEGFQGSWYTGTIVGFERNTPPAPSSSPSSTRRKRKMEPEIYLVEYATLLEDDDDENDEKRTERLPRDGEETPKKPLRESVEVRFMRPLPPPTESQHVYEVNDVVDAFHRDGWWTGVVAEVLDEGSRFMVHFDDNPPENVEFVRSALRVHHDWVDNKWVRAEKKARILLDDCTPQKAAKSAKGLKGQSIKGSGTKTPLRCRRLVKSSEKSKENKKKRVNDRHSQDFKKEVIEPNTAVCSQDRKRGRPKKLMTENPIVLVNGEVKNGAESAAYEMVVDKNPSGEEKNGAESTSNAMVVKDCASKDGEELTLAGICPQGIPILNDGYPSRLPHGQYNIMDNILDSFLAKVGDQISETIAGKSGRKSRSCTSKRRKHGSRTDHKTPTKGSQGSSRGEQSEQCEDRPQLVWYDSNTREACIEKAHNESKDRPQLTLLEGMNSRYTVDGSKTSFYLSAAQSADASDGQDENAMQSPAIVTCDSNASEKDKKLSFEKHSPIWATLERMEIFQKMPQNPHFHPLVKSKEESREGLAIGQMVIFSSVVEKTSKLQFTDPRSIIDSSLETLSDLETHGFDVNPIRSRLKELLLKKENQGHLLEESKEVERKISEHSVEKAKLGEEICEINKKMEELQEKLGLATAMEKMTAYEIDTLKSEMVVIDQAVQQAQLDFERLAAAPWQML